MILFLPSGMLYRATRDWRGRVVSTLNSEHITTPDDAEIAARWGTGYIHARRISFPVASGFTFEGDKTPLDQLTIKKTHLLDFRAEEHPAHFHEKSGPNPRHRRKGLSAMGHHYCPLLRRITSSEDYHLPYKATHNTPCDCYHY
jgi:hypothetical protein